ncbi:rubredoxin-like domain-containing protein [Proteinivorax hydrogeniformans]|uniref:Rubredoxin-like domain-containing protein n=1 Tax=Proteinivorax hydrogeniformans TaxID=1826727 RepID=A0AAU8HUT5_9FIRM
MYKCTVCNYLNTEDEAPEKCPKCGAPQEKFEKLKKEHVDKITRSRQTNYLLKDLITSMETINDIADQGIDDDLDPGCRKLFTEAKESAEFLRQTAMAEIENHIGKGKWG